MLSTGNTMISQTHMAPALCGLWSKTHQQHRKFFGMCYEGEILIIWSERRTSDSQEFLRSDIRPEI